MSDRTSASQVTDSRGAEPVLLRVEDLEKYYPISGGILNRTTGYVRAVDGVSFTVPTGETFAVVGESGCGKTTLGKTVARLLAPTGGRIEFDGRDITDLSNRQLKSVRRELQVVYQDPTSSLNPRRRVESIIMDPLKVHDIGTASEHRERVADIMDRVDLPPDYKHRYPGALSGGQKQRVAIARALVMNPKLLVLDEPTSALDVSVQAKIISLLEELQAELDLTYLIISHDLSLVKNIATRIGVMYLGQFVETGETDRLFRNPQNPYTEQLISAIPTIDEAEQALKPPKIDIRGEPPDPSNPPSGCRFHTRCHKRFEPCDTVAPELVETEGGHRVRCLLRPGPKEEAVDQFSTAEERRRLRQRSGGHVDQRDPTDGASREGRGRTGGVEDD